MRTLFLALLLAAIPSFAHAQDTASDTDRLNQALFVHRPSAIEFNSSSGYGVLGLRFGELKVVPSYSLSRSGESWRQPESGQEMTNSQIELKAYLVNHPIVRFGISALMRSGRHADTVSGRDPATLPARLGHEPDRNDVKIHFSFAF